MSDAEDLLNRQNADGGWSYSRGSSWTEPTCYALLGLRAAGSAATSAFERGAAWLARCQRSDGGFAPRESVRESTWLAALVLLLPTDLQKHLDADNAARWLVDQSGRESGWVFRLRLFLAGARVEESFAFDGWPWYTGAAAWIAPTALSVLALEKISRGRDAVDARRQAIDARTQRGTDFLLARRCRDQGWNHGSTRALGYDSDSYPETTGLALLALHSFAGGTPSAHPEKVQTQEVAVEKTAREEVEQGIARGEALLAGCRSQEAASWLSLGLSAHGRTPVVPELASHGTTMELALSALAASALRGQNLFLAS
jgi:hypothetical protein